MNPEVMTPGELRWAAQGCTELTCLYHGAFNAELVKRGEPRSGYTVEVRP